MKFWNYLKRWQEFLGWAPLVAVIALTAWLVLGALDPLAVVDALAQLVDLPIRAVWALVALGLAYLTWRRWSYRLTEEQMNDLWNRLMAGERGAIVAFSINAGFYLCVTLALLYFFSPR
jgi:hypothetical protein